MNILIVTAHDKPESLTAALYNTSLGVLERAEHVLEMTELYSHQFNAVASLIDFQTSSGVHTNYMFEQQRSMNIGSGFSPDITAEMQKITKAELIIFHFPLWWSAPPAILKGWFERVFAMGFAWNSGSRYEAGLLRGKKALIVTSCGDPESYYSPDGMHKATVQQHLYPLMHGILAYSGLDVLKPFIVHNVTAAEKKELDVQIDSYRLLLQSIESYDSYLYKY